MAEADKTTVQMVVAAAIAAAGPIGSNPGAWRSKVNVLIPQCAALLDEDSSQCKMATMVLEAAVWTGVYISHTIEESSTRAIVTLAKNADGETETIRTDRTDRPTGKAIVDQLGRLEPGTEIRVWKAMEPIAGNTQGHKVRVMVHFEPTFRNAGQQRPPAADREGAESPPATEPPPPPPAESAPLDPRLQAIRDNIKTQKDPARTAAALKAAWPGGVTSIPDHQLERAIYMSLHEGEEPF